MSHSNINNKIKFKFSPNDNQLDEFIDKVKSFGIIYYNKYSFRECPINIKEERKYIVTGHNRNIYTKTGTNEYYAGAICEDELDKTIEEHKYLYLHYLL